MILTTIAAAILLGPSAKGLSCPVQGGPVSATAPTVEYAGLQVGFCCGGCDSEFKANPGSYLKKAAKGGKTVALDLFDPVSGRRISQSKAKATEDFKGVRYLFASVAERKSFDKSRARYTALPSKESKSCPVSGEKIGTYAEAGGYVDYKGVRYYVCCPNCLATLKKAPAKVVAKKKAKVGAVVAYTAKPVN